MKKKLLFGVCFLILQFSGYTQTLNVGIDSEQVKLFPIISGILSEAGMTARQADYPAGRSIIKANAGEIDGEAFRALPLAANVDCESYPGSPQL